MLNKMTYVVEVIPVVHIPRPHRGVFSYRADRVLPRGALVEVSLGRRVVLGIVAGKGTQTSRRLKNISRVISAEPLFPKPAMQFLEWEAMATLTPLGDILRRAIPAWMRLGKWSARPGRGTDGERKGAFSKKRSVGVTPMYGEDTKRFQRYRAFVELILRSGGQVLVLAPTLAARDVLLAALPKRKTVVAPPQGKTKKAQELWLRIRAGEPICIVGTRAALRLPFVNLRLVILDDEANEFWKETREHPYTDGRVAAPALASFHGARLVVGGMFPFLDTFSSLKGKAALPKVRGESIVIDLNQDRPKASIATPLYTELRKIAEGRGMRRALVFVNRRGSALALTCADCGFVFTCKSCDAPLPVYRKDAHSELKCRHCGEVFIPAPTCPSCRGFRLYPRGIAGAGVERVVRKIVPNAWVGRLDTDTAPRTSDQSRILQEFSSQEKPAVLVATALVFNKRLPKLDLVAVPAFDQLSTMPDFRAEEQLFRTMTSLSALLKSRGKLVVQTWHPENPSLSTALNGDFLSFATQELGLRKQFGWPPYRRIAKLTFAHRDAKRAESEATRISDVLARTFQSTNLQVIQSAEILGPSPAFIPRMRNRYIWHIIVKWKPRAVPLRGTTKNTTQNYAELDLRMEEKLWKIIPSVWDVDVYPSSIL